LVNALRDLVREVVREELARERLDRRGDEFLTVRKAAEFAQVSPPTIRRWIKKGWLASHRKGKRLLRVTRSDVKRVLRREHRLPVETSSAEQLADALYG
jgi:excisionase family DNA binding protein